MKKILYVTTISNTINAFLVPHINHLIRQGYKVDCAASLHDELESDLIKKGVKFFEIPFSRNPLDINNIKAFRKLINIQKEYQYDIVHVHTPIAAMYGRLLKLKFPNLKTIYTAHGFHFYKGAPKKNWMIYYPIEKIMSKFTDTIITINEEDYNQALKFNIKNTYKVNGVGIDLSHYNPNLYKKDEVRKELGLRDDDFVIVMIAEVNQNKNHIQMVKAIEILKKKGIEVKVICAGKGPLLENIKEEIRKRNLDENIFMLGFRSDIPKLITACDIGILLSYREGLPRNIMELMAYGKPVIGTDIRGIRDLVENDVNGYIVELNNPLKTSETIEYIYNNKPLIDSMSQKSFEMIEKYDIGNIVDKIVEIVDFVQVNSNAMKI